MKKVFVFILVAIAVFSCQKRAVDPSSAEQEVVFTGVDASADGQKSTDTDCDNPTANYASVVVNGNTYRPAIFYLGGIAYTQSIKFISGNYSISEFLLMNDNNTPGDLSDDQVVKAAPMAGAEYAAFVTQPLPMSFTVEPFKKTEVPIEVICFEEAEYQAFGFDWFVMTEIVVREQVFFGDFCVSYPEDYEGSLYASQANGVQIDMPAIFRIDVYRNGAFLVSYNNEDWFGEGQVLKVHYPDHENAADHFDLYLYVLVRTCAGFEYKYFTSWWFDDDQMITAGSDNVVDFVLGDCSTGADFVLPPYDFLYLPPSAIAEIPDYGPGTLETFFDIKLHEVDIGYRIENGTWPGWSGDFTSVVFDNPNRDGGKPVDIYSSLCPESLPDFAGQENKNWEAVNWLMNNLDQYPGYQWDDIQGAIWLITDDNPGWDGSAMYGLRSLSELEFAYQMYNEAIVNGVGYVPTAGGVAAAIFIYEEVSRDDDPTKINLVFVDLDP